MLLKLQSGQILIIISAASWVTHFLFWRIEKIKTRSTGAALNNFYGPTPFFDLDDVEPILIPEADCVDANGKPILANLLTDVLISAEVLFPQGEE